MAEERRDSSAQIPAEPSPTAAEDSNTVEKDLRALHFISEGKGADGTEDTTVDIVTVHDLTGYFDIEAAAADAAGKVNGEPLAETKVETKVTQKAAAEAVWLSSLLKQSIPNARILGFEYKLDNGMINVQRRATDLLEEVSALRVSSLELVRPLVFVGVGLGGTIIKQALRIANTENKYLPIAAWTRSLIFFGTPHRVRSFSDWKHVALDLALDLVRARPEEALIAEVINDLPETLREISSFSTFADRYDIVTFREEKRKDGDKSHALEVDELGLSSETSRPRKGRGRDMCKFTKNEDDYKLVVSTIKTAAETYEPSVFNDASTEYNEYIQKYTSQELRHVYFYSTQAPLHLPEACEWVLQDEIYKSWFNDAEGNSRLHLSGDSSHGQAALLAFLANIFRSRHTIRPKDRDRKELVKEDRTILYTTFGGKDEHEKTPEKILLSLNYQLFCHRPRLFQQVSSLWPDTEFNDTPNAWAIFRAIMLSAEQGNVICFIEVVEESGPSLELLESLIEFQRELENPFDLVIAGNASLDYCSKEKSHYVINLEESNIENFVERGIDEIVRRQPLYADFRADVKEAICRPFPALLPATLKLKRLSTLNALWTPSSIRQELRGLQCDLPMVYKQIMEDITVDQAWARRVLSWILFSFRPLKCTELAVALAAESPQILEDIPVDIERDLRRVFGHLIDTESGDVRLIHPSFREFLLDKERCQEGQWYAFEAPHVEHERLASACIVYLSRRSNTAEDPFVRFVRGKPELYNDPDLAYTDTTDLPFVSYALWHWYRHYRIRYKRIVHSVTNRKLNPGLKDEVLRFLKGPAAAKWYHLEDDEKSSRAAGTALWQSARMGLADIAKEILDTDKKITCIEKAAAIHVAAYNGVPEIVEHILKTGLTSSIAVDKSVKDKAAVGDEVELNTQADAICKPVVTDAPDGGATVDTITASGNVNLETAEKIELLGTSLEKTENLEKPLADDKNGAPDAGDVDLQIEESKSEPNEPEKDGSLIVALEAAAHHGFTEIVNLLLTARKNGELSAPELAPITDEDINSSLSLSAYGGSCSSINKFLEFGAPINGDPESTASRALHSAVRCGYAKATALLLEKGADVEMGEETHKITPLQAAALNGQSFAVRQLLENGATVDAVSDTNSTALHYAADWGRLPVVKMLLDKGADINHRDGDARTPLHLACISGRYLTVLELVKRKCDIEATDQHGAMPMHHAATKGDVRCLEFLVDHGAKVSPGTESKDTPLHSAAEYGRAKAVKKLLELGANVDASNKEKERPLHKAAWAGSEECVSELLEGGAFEDSKSSDLTTPLYQAASSGYEKIVDLLLTAGADPNSQNKEKWAPVHWSYINDNIKMATKMKESGGDVNLQGDLGWKPIGLAALCGSLAVLKALYGWGADPNHCNENDENSMHNAISSESIPMVKFLIEEAKMDPKRTVRKKFNYLHHAVTYSSLEMVKFWVEEQHLDPLAPAKGDYSPYTVVMRAANDDRMEGIVTYFVERATEMYDQRIIYSLAASGQEWTIEHLVQCAEKFDMDAVDDHGRQALFYAAANGRIDIIKYFLDRGQDKDRQDLSGRTPMDVALQEDARDVLLGRAPKEKTEVQAQEETPDQEKTLNEDPENASAELEKHEEQVPLEEKDEQEAATKAEPDVSADANLGKEVDQAGEEKDKNEIEQEDKNFKNLSVDADQIISYIYTRDNFTTTDCDVCSCLIHGFFSHCLICNDDDFDICKECLEKGGYCKDKEHKLVRLYLEDCMRSSSKYSPWVEEGVSPLKAGVPGSLARSVSA